VSATKQLKNSRQSFIYLMGRPQGHKTNWVNISSSTAQLLRFQTQCGLFYQRYNWRSDKTISLRCKLSTRTCGLRKCAL